MEKFQLLLMPVQLHAGAGMCPDEPRMRVVAQRLLQLGEIERIALALEVMFECSSTGRSNSAARW